MKMHAVIAGAALVLNCSHLVSAEIDFCSIEKAVGIEYKEAIDVAAARAALSLGNLDRFRELIDSRDWADDAPVQDQMSAEEMAEFSKYQASMQSHNLAALLESKRERDILAIGRMSKLVKMWADGHLVEYGVKSLSEQDQVLVSIVALLEETIVRDSIDFDRSVGLGCSIENALTKEASRIALTIDDDMLEQAINELNRLKGEYGELNQENMGDKDYAYFVGDIVPVIRGENVKLDHSANLHRLILAEEVSELMMESWKVDLYMAPGDAKYVGTTIQSWKEEGRFSDRQLAAGAVLNILNDKIPPSMFDMLKEASDTTAPSEK